MKLFDEGSTVPFVSRYRKEMTGSLDETQLRAIQERAAYLRDLDARRATILKSIQEQGALTPELRRAIEGATAKTALEDLYLPYKPKRTSRAAKARELGLAPLADAIWQQRSDAPQALVDRYRGDLDRDAAWQGARDIVAERIADDAAIRAGLREALSRHGMISAKRSRSKKAKPEAVEKFRDFLDYQEPVQRIRLHRVLALRRGEAENVLRVGIEGDSERALSLVRRRIPQLHGPLARELELAAADAYERLLAPAVENDVRSDLNERADKQALEVFADNFKNLLFAAPFGPKAVLALDPGFRSGCKLVVLAADGALLHHDVVFPHPPQQRSDEAKTKVTRLANMYDVRAIAIGNGTAGRETEAFVKSLRDLPDGCQVVSVDESGASVYSASELAREEFPDHDVTVRGAVSIGRRLQDPLAELVKLDPRSIGVGQYQHDLHQPTLQRTLDGVVESCVNHVGVEINTASARLLSYVSGIGETIARNIVAHRAATKGGFKSRRDLLKVPRLGQRAFEQAAGFIRVRGGTPLDASAVHPESYDVVERMARDRGVGVADLVGNAELVKQIDPKRYVDERRQEPTLKDILAELEKPGRDPRETFSEIGFREDITEIEHLSEGMNLNGAVTNVTDFGAFVDIGVHQDGLVHVSQLANRFVEHPSQVVRVGDRVRVKVVSIDRARRRIGLSIKQADG